MPRHSRRGSVYLIVLMSVLMIVVTGLSGLYVARVQGRSVTSGVEVDRARVLASGAVEVGAQMIAGDASWRTSFGNGDWFKGRGFDGGTMSLSVTDPADGDVADAALDPIVMRGVGTFGGATQAVEVRVEAVPTGVDGLGSMVHAGGALGFDGATVGADAWLTSNGSAWATAATVNADVGSVGSISGSTYKRSTAAVEALTMPIAKEVMDTWTALATPIDLADVASASAERIENGHFEFSKNQWSNYNCSLSVTSLTSKFGSSSLRVYNRSGFTSGPRQDVTADMANGASYRVSAWVKAELLGGNMRIALIIEENDGDVQTFYSPTAGVGILSWSEITGTVTPTWNAADGLKAATLTIESTSSAFSYTVDGLSMMPTVTPDAELRHVVLTPDLNPYGAGSTSAAGVYSIDCAGADLVIRDCRIHGTLVLIDPGPNSRVEGSVAWTVPDTAPALIVRGDIAVETSDADLVEADLDVNFNPFGSGFADQDAEANDMYASQIEGLVYATGDISTDNRPRIFGVVIAGGDITFRGDDVRLTHKPIYLSDPPAAFEGIAAMAVDPRSWAKAVE